MNINVSNAEPTSTSKANVNAVQDVIDFISNKHPVSEEDGVIKIYQPDGAIIEVLKGQWIWI